MYAEAGDEIGRLLRESAAGFLAERHSLARLRAQRDRPDLPGTPAG